MNLARTLGIYLLTLAWLTPAARELPGKKTASQVDPSPQASPSQAQSTEPTKAAPVEKKVDSAGPAKPSPQRHRRHKKKTLPNCTNAATALNPAPGGSSNSANPITAGTASSVPASGNSDSGAGSTKSASAEANPAKSDSSTLPPCPPPKKVIPNGGSDEPTIQLLGGSSAEQASNQRSTEQLIATTDENLRKIAERRLPPNSQETVNQIKQFIDQSKTAVAKGDAERGHNLAQKAHLLSEELLKP